MAPDIAFIDFKSEAHPIAFVASRSFKKAAGAIFTAEEYSGFLNFIAANPDTGDKIPGGHGLRKMRWKARGAGKRGGARVVYFFRDLNMPLLLLAVYAKNQQIRLSKREVREIERKMQEIITKLCVERDALSA